MYCPDVFLGYTYVGGEKFQRVEQPVLVLFPQNVFLEVLFCLYFVTLFITLSGYRASICDFIVYFGCFGIR